MMTNLEPSELSSRDGKCLKRSSGYCKLFKSVIETLDTLSGEGEGMLIIDMSEGRRHGALSSTMLFKASGENVHE